jgi:hypothetical protein
MRWVEVFCIWRRLRYGRERWRFFDARRSTKLAKLIPHLLKDGYSRDVIDCQPKKL